jgi:hypothetical protein
VVGTFHRPSGWVKRKPELEAFQVDTVSSLGPRRDHGRPERPTVPTDRYQASEENEGTVDVLFEVAVSDRDGKAGQVQLGIRSGKPCKPKTDDLVEPRHWRLGVGLDW